MYANGVVRTVQPHDVLRSVQPTAQSCCLCRQFFGGIITAHDEGIGRGILAARGTLEQKKSIDLGRPWAVSLMRRMGYAQRKGTKAARKLPDDIAAVTTTFHERIKNIATEFSIPRKCLFITF